jgi:TolB-like protein/Tfp pilus assembly protein PilF
VVASFLQAEGDVQLPVVEELKRRRVFRALVAYGIAAFAVLQIVEPITHALHLPDATLTYIVVALALAFPVVLVGGLLTGAPKGWRHSIWRKKKRVTGTVEPMPAVASIAVLPFADMSAAKDQEYFADGISEEILNALAQLEDLKVSGRTSSFSFKGKTEDVRSIGEKLGVSAVLEGSVRRSGNRVRITAQLVKAADGFHFWSQTYDRELTDIFAVQDDIARAVLIALKLKLLPRGIKPQRTANPEAHNEYLLGLHLYARGSSEGYTRAVQALEKAVALDPGYAVAWAALARAIFFVADQALTARSSAYGLAEALPKAAEAANKAITLAPDLAEGWAARGLLRTLGYQDWTGARADFERALAISPGHAEILLEYAYLIDSLGRLREAIAVLRKAIALDPLCAESWTELAIVHLGTRELDLAEKAARQALEVSPSHSRAARTLGFAYLLAGRFAEARAAFRLSSHELYVLMGDALVEHELGHPAEAQRALDEILARPYALQASYQIAQVYAWRGAADPAFEWLDRAYDVHDPGLSYVKYDPLLRGLRDDQRYHALLTRMNFPVE